MADYIDRKEYVNRLNDEQIEYDEFYKGLGKAKYGVDQKHGHWRLNETGSIECSNCYSQDDRIYGFCNSNDFEYCPWCGAKMDEVTEDE